MTIFIFAGCCFACGNASQTTEHRDEKPMGTDSMVNVPAARDTVTQLTIEEAETLVSKHYSALNREAQYLLYRYLLVKIDSISAPNGDTVPIFATVNGRKWLSPNGDTTTQSFRESIRLGAYRQDNAWQSR
jgi:hypothetical protein